MPTYAYTVTLETDSEECAEQVMGERLGPDEDYGFAYRFKNWTMATTTPEQNEARALIPNVLRECEEVANAPSMMPTWRIRSALTEAARIIRQLTAERVTQTTGNIDWGNWDKDSMTGTTPK